MKEKHYIVTYFNFLAICTKTNTGSTWYPIEKILKHDTNLPHYSKLEVKSFPQCGDLVKVISEHDSFEEALEQSMLELL